MGTILLCLLIGGLLKALVWFVNWTGKRADEKHRQDMAKLRGPTSIGDLGQSELDFHTREILHRLQDEYYRTHKKSPDGDAEWQIHRDAEARMKVLQAEGKLPEGRYTWRPHIGLDRH